MAFLALQIHALPPRCFPAILRLSLEGCVTSSHLYTLTSWEIWCSMQLPHECMHNLKQIQAKQKAM